MQQGVTAYFKDAELLAWFRDTAEGEMVSLSQFLVQLVAQERERRYGNEEAGMGKLYTKLDQHDKKLDSIREELLKELRKRPVVERDVTAQPDVAVVSQLVEYDLTGLGVGGFDD